jgi:large subunit ribosomal protein L14
MIQPETHLSVADNTGAKIAKCIKTFKTSRYNQADIGSIIAVSIQKADAHKKVKKGQVKLGLIIRTKKGIHRKDGTSLRFGDNSIVLITHDNKGEIIPVGTRIFGPVIRELRNKKLMKVISLAPYII